MEGQENGERLVVIQQGYLWTTYRNRVDVTRLRPRQNQDTVDLGRSSSACVLDPGGVSLQFQRLGPVSYKAE